VRGAVSILVAPGGRGKTSWIIGLSLACASGRPLLDAHVFGGPLRVLLINAEDSNSEIALLRAAMHHQALEDSDLPELHVAGAGD
jgi:RecA-family ATPase